MRMQELSLDTIPPIHIPFRFFLSAPWMGVLAGLLLLTGTWDAFSSRWTPELLGATHLLTLGFMAMVMLGAMFQLVPVISGKLIPGGAAVATLVHIPLLAGTLLLVAAFYWQAYGWFHWAMPLLALAFTIFLLALGSLLIRRMGGGDAIFTIRFAALALLITVGMGLLRAAQYAGLPAPTGVAGSTDGHLAWGLGGWVLLLVMGASYQVIPMFHVTPGYPTLPARALPVVVLCSLLLLLLQQPVVQTLAIACLSAAALTYAAYSLHLLNQRKRKIADITVTFWRLSLVCLALAALLLLVLNFAGDLITAAELRHRLPVAIGALMIYGFAGSVIMGMLQKIIPFLIYLHLQRRCLANFELLKTLPHMGNIMPGSRGRWQFRLHAAALALLLAAILTGLFIRTAAILVVADFAWLGLALARATLLYRRSLARVLAA